MRRILWRHGRLTRSERFLDLDAAPRPSIGHPGAGMGLKVFGPAEDWPRHGKSWWRDALDVARRAGWTLEYLNAPHTFGFVRCPGGCHSAKVDCTAIGGESYATDCARDARECRASVSTGPGSKVQDRIEQAEGLLDTAEDLLDRATELITLAAERIEAFDSLERLACLEHAELAIETARTSVAGVTGLDLDTEEASDAGDGSVVAGVGVGVDAALSRAEAAEDHPTPEVVGDVVDSASAATEEAAQVVKKINRAGLKKPLLHRVAEAQTRIETLRARLDAMQTPESPQGPDSAR